MCGGGDLGGSNNKDNDKKKGSGNSAGEKLANAITPNDGFSYRDGVLTADRARNTYTPVSSNPNEERDRNILVRNSDDTGSFFVPKSETKKYNDGLVMSAVFGGLTGGLPGIAAGIGGNMARNALFSGGGDGNRDRRNVSAVNTNVGSGTVSDRFGNAIQGATGIAGVTPGGFTDPSTYTKGVQYGTTNDGGFKGMFQPGGFFAGPQFETAEERSKYMLEQKNRAVEAGRSMADGSDNNDDRVRQTVTTPTAAAPAGSAMSDMSKAAAQGGFEPIPNPDYDPNDPMSPRFLINPSYAQLLEYQQSQVTGMAMGGLTQFAEGGELEQAPQEGIAAVPQEGGNEKTDIVDAVMAVKGEMSKEEASVALGKFLATYGEEALKNLVEAVQSGELDDTIERFANGEAGEVNGPGDGSGVDDKVPASLEGQQDVLLADGEFVLRKKTADALEKKYGGGFLDTINEAENDAPRVIRELAARTA